MQYPSKLIEDAVNAFAKMPGIGKKTALRLVLHLLQNESKNTEQFTFALQNMRNNIKFCSVCSNVSDEDICSICNNPYRNKKLICVVENFRDILAIEQTQQYNGVYHILNGLISPIDGIGPDDLNINSLEERIQQDEAEEIIMAVNPTIDGDTTIFYLSKKLSMYDIKITTIARGISFGGELEFTDEVTLARSLQARLPYEQYLNKY
ncbi:MAG: recombination protein RecR [Chitinophagales bacterium]|nr:recombination protein RecR [Chitinophagales bacterium]